MRQLAWHWSPSLTPLHCTYPSLFLPLLLHLYIPLQQTEVIDETLVGSKEK